MNIDQVSDIKVLVVRDFYLSQILIVISQTGIYGGLTEELFNDIREGTDPTISTPPSSLLPQAHYERMAAVFGDVGHFCTTIPQLQKAVTQALSDSSKPSLINVLINPMAQRKTQDFDWLTRSKL